MQPTAHSETIAPQDTLLGLNLNLGQPCVPSETLLESIGFFPSIKPDTVCTVAGLDKKSDMHVWLIQPGDATPARWARVFWRLK